jgi:hypothetical protein
MNISLETGLFRADDLKCRPVRAESFNDAALIFAKKYAKRCYGRKSAFNALNNTGGSNTVMFYSAFIGRHLGDGTISGRNITFCVDRAAYPLTI